MIVTKYKDESEPFYCPYCGSEKNEYLGTDDTEVYECQECRAIYGVICESHT